MKEVDIFQFANQLELRIGVEIVSWTKGVNFHFKLKDSRISFLFVHHHSMALN